MTAPLHGKCSGCCQSIRDLLRTDRLTKIAGSRDDRSWTLPKAKAKAWAPTHAPLAAGGCFEIRAAAGTHRRRAAFDRVVDIISSGGMPTTASTSEIHGRRQLAERCFHRTQAVLRRVARSAMKWFLPNHGINKKALDISATVIGASGH